MNEKINERLNTDAFFLKNHKGNDTCHCCQNIRIHNSIQFTIDTNFIECIALCKGEDF